MHGREEVVVVSVEEYRRVKGQLTGEALMKLLRFIAIKVKRPLPRGTEEPAAMYRAFRGRDAKVKPLPASRGLQ